MEEKGGRGQDWTGVLGLAAFLYLVAATTGPLLVAIAYLPLLLVDPGRRFPALLAVFPAALLLWGGGPGDGIWHIERGWGVLVAGSFAALTLRWPEAGLLHRSLAAVSAAAAVTALLFMARPESWAVTDWLMTDRIEERADWTLFAFQTWRGHGELLPELVTLVRESAELQARLFPALLGLASLAALGLASWLHSRLSQGRGVLGALRTLRFNDQLVWIFIAGLFFLLVGPGEASERLGANAVVFMGALYALRGAGVGLFIKGRVSVFGWIVVALAVLVASPVVLLVAVTTGLADTWLDFRTRFAARGS